MIAFDLQCANGHCFEGWFEDGEAFQQQKETSLVHCPMCGDAHIHRLPSTFGIQKASSTGNGSPHQGDVEAFHRRLAELVESHCEDVGADFAKEALKIHYGAAEPRSIRGTTTKAEEKLLAKEKVPFFKFLLPRASDSDG